MTAVRRASKSRHAYHWIKERIVNRQFTPGYRLVMGSLAEELQMSAVPIREAIRQLEAEGLVTFEHNVGPRVALIDTEQYGQAMQAIAIIESAATALSVPHLTFDDLSQARALNAMMRGSLTDFDPKAFSALNQRFHKLLYSRCSNPVLLKIVTVEWERLANLRDTIFKFAAGRPAESVHEHDLMLDLIEAGAPAEEIETAMRHHRGGTLRAYLTGESPERSLLL